MTSRPLDLPSGGPATRDPAAAAALAAALGDPAVRARYLVKVRRVGPDGCWYWVGAISSSSGHGRFWATTLGPPDRRHLVVIAHRFGWALAHGVAALTTAAMLTHTCDEPSCQNPLHLTPGTPWSNHHDWLTRRWVPHSPCATSADPPRGPAPSVPPWTWDSTTTPWLVRDTTALPPSTAANSPSGNPRVPC